MVYVSVSIALYVIDDKRMFFKFFVLLWALLGLNVVGCHLAVSATGGA